MKEIIWNPEPTHRQIIYDEMEKDQSGKIWAYITSGAACESPIIYYDEKESVFKFDSYGSVFKNWKEWDRCYNYGGSGSAGNVKDIHVVYRSCLSVNKELKRLVGEIKEPAETKCIQHPGRIALITKEVHKRLIDSGYNIEIVDFGFN